MKLNPSVVQGVLEEYGFDAKAVISEEPDIEPSTVEIDNGSFSLIFEDPVQLVQEIDGSYVTRAESNNLTELLDYLREYRED